MAEGRWWRLREICLVRVVGAYAWFFVFKDFDLFCFKACLKSCFVSRCISWSQIAGSLEFKGLRTSGMMWIKPTNRERLRPPGEK